MRTKVTINDVARLAEVSVATVSYVLNKNPKKTISAETTRRVLDAAKQLNYISNSAAKTLQSSRTNCIGVVVYQSLTLPRHAQTLQGMIDALREQSYSILFCSSKRGDNGYPEYLNTYFAHKIDGIVYLGADASALEPDVENVIVEQRIPFVVCDCETNRNISSIVIDYFKGAYDMTAMLLDKGVKKVFYIRPDVNNRQEREREQGVRRAVFEKTDVSLSVLLMPYSVNVTNAGSVNPGASGSINRFFDHYGSFLEEKTAEMDAESALICSWSGMDQISILILRRKGLNIPVATLAQGNLTCELFDHLYYSHLPNLLIGKTCAASILRLFDDENAIRHEVIEPSLEPIFI